MIVNGKEMDFQEGITVEQLLNELNLPKEKVVVEVNLNIIDVSTYSSTALNKGDRVEIVRFVGGG
ncbi:sulfur carrier protein ThiS [Serpentinicella alkaliphila]|uniref:Sulfur carrier protein n=1 Tax=Serpentinicella alkaliphila TaxID=1734049 RepID=A0A4R2THL8_9FIRM|nr:sulfur carrier protein ThiS [Serpentinicella alkaliphila]QUH24661.1 sulfur carrier protein ThiS [Serpentinicella alkaliphila]TCQ03080.1 sulfur carrier protein [Serpentinicella alkaliphila]